MSEQTSFLQLEKPLLAEKYDVKVFNENMDIVDANVAGLTRQIKTYALKRNADKKLYLCYTTPDNSTEVIVQPLITDVVTVNGKFGEVELNYEDVGAAPTNILDHLDVNDINEMYENWEILLSEWEQESIDTIPDTETDFEDKRADFVDNKVKEYTSRLTFVKSVSQQDGLVKVVKDVFPSSCSYTSDNKYVKGVALDEDGTVRVLSKDIPDYVKTIKMNGTSKNVSGGVIDLGVVITKHQDISGKMDTSARGATNGVASLVDGLVPASQLPSYVDDVIEYDTLADFPTKGEEGKLYVAKDTNLIYRWTGSIYANTNTSLALGETSTTAFRGDWGKIAYDYAMEKHAPSDAQKNVQSDWKETDTSSDAYIKNKPTIPPTVNEATVTGWGFTKNEGTVTGVKGDVETTYQTDKVNITPDGIGALQISGVQTLSDAQKEQGCENLGIPFKFGIDTKGNYGYYKSGSPTLTPFQGEASSYVAGVKGAEESAYRTGTVDISPTNIGALQYTSSQSLTADQQKTARDNIGIPFRFGVDSSGNYGYYKEGESIITPFKTGSSGGTESRLESLTLLMVDDTGLDTTYTFILGEDVNYFSLSVTEGTPHVL